MNKNDLTKRLMTKTQQVFIKCFKPKRKSFRPSTNYGTAKKLLIQFGCAVHLHHYILEF